MRWTNLHNIDPVIAQAVMTDDYEAVGDISVSRLVKPPQITALEHQHEEEITQDVTDGLFMLEGRALHHILDLARDETRLQEYRLTVESNGWTVSGQFDVLYLKAYPPQPGDMDPHPADLGKNAILKDYKVSSVWSHMLGGKEDHEMQLNFYAYLAMRNQIRVDELRVVMWFRDWQKSQVERDRQYPPLKVIEHPIDLWTPDYVAPLFEERVKLHQAAAGAVPRQDGVDSTIFVQAGTYPPCTAEERWARPDSWAVMKLSAKKAYRVFEEPTMAKAMADSMRDYEVVHRPGVNMRCASYCSVMPFCQQAKELGVVKDGN